MPLSATSNKVMKSMQKEYGAKKGKSVFYATANKKGGKAENAGTWEKKKAAAHAFAGILKRAAHAKKAEGEDLTALLRAYAPYLAAGGLGGVLLGDDETPLLERLLGGAAIGGLGGYGMQNYGLPWLQGQGVDIPGALDKAKGFAQEKGPQVLEDVRGATQPLLDKMQEAIHGPAPLPAAEDPRMRRLSSALMREKLRGSEMRRRDSLGLVGRAQEDLTGAANAGIDQIGEGAGSIMRGIGSRVDDAGKAVGRAFGGAGNLLFGNNENGY